MTSGSVGAALPQPRGRGREGGGRDPVLGRGVRLRRRARGDRCGADVAGPPGGLGDLTSTDYGRTLLVKLVFVAGLVALGWGAGAWWPAGCSVRRCGARWRPRW